MKFVKIIKEEIKEVLKRRAKIFKIFI